jgi:hypothetical protein
MLGAMAGWTGTFAALQAIRVLLARHRREWATRNGANCTCSTGLCAFYAHAQHRQGPGVQGLCELVARAVDEPRRQILPEARVRTSAGLTPMRG